MGLIAAKCTQCGAVLQVDDNQDAAICSHCGTPFIVEKAINNYNMSIVNNIAADNVVVSTDGFATELDKLRFHNQMKHWDEAKSLAARMQREYPNHSETWYESAVATSESFTVFPARQGLDECLKYLSSLSDDNSSLFRKVLEYWNLNEEYLKSEKYNRAVKKMESADSSYYWNEAANVFKEILDYSDARELYEKCLREVNRLKKIEDYRIKRNGKIVLIILAAVAIVAGTWFGISIHKEKKMYEAARAKYKMSLETNLTHLLATDYSASWVDTVSTEIYMDVSADNDDDRVVINLRLKEPLTSLQVGENLPISQLRAIYYLHELGNESRPPSKPLSARDLFSGTVEIHVIYDNQEQGSGTDSCKVKWE